MSHTLNIAAVRMDASLSNVESRLNRAQSLVLQAVKQSAQLIVLPELFNTGYQYTLQNYQSAETANGKTVSWMKHITREQGIHLAGSLLLRDSDGIYNAMLLVAPDGCLWRYDKSYPWAWERAYFRPRKKPIQVAETSLGKVGMLICWDVGHANLWRQYAGKIDLIVSSSCPPIVHTLAVHLPDGRIVNTDELSRILQIACRGADKVFGEFYLNQARWLGVPSVNTTGAGVFQSHLPDSRFATTLLFATRPNLWKYISQAEKVTVSARYFNDTFVADAEGNILAKTELDDDELIVATVELVDKTPHPSLRQPRYGLGVLTYLMDFYINAALQKYYDQHWHHIK